MRRRFIQIDGELHEVKDVEFVSAPMVQPDIQPYKSMIDGSMITSRSKHLEHLNRHGYVEVGNDSSLTKPHTGIPDVSPQKRKELIRSQIDRLPEKEFRAMHKRFVDNLKWNSRER